MTDRKLPLIMAAAVGLLVGISTAAMGQSLGTIPQTTGSSVIAPSASGPAYNLGGVGAGNVPLAPGAATVGSGEMERTGPGGGLLAPGPAGNLSGAPLVSSPVLPRTR